MFFKLKFISDSSQILMTDGLVVTAEICDIGILLSIYIFIVTEGYGSSMLYHIHEFKTLISSSMIEFSGANCNPRIRTRNIHGIKERLP